MITVEFSGSITLTGTIEDFIVSFNNDCMTIADYIAETDRHDCVITKITTVDEDNPM